MSVDHTNARDRPPGRVCGLYRYPVKGLSAEPLDSVDLTAGEGFPGDRRFALALPGTQFDPVAPEPIGKTGFLMLMRNASLARLRCEFDAARGHLEIWRDGTLAVGGQLSDAADRAAIEAFFESYCADEVGGRPRLVSAPGHRFTDVGVRSAEMMRAVSLINLNSIRALESAAGRPLDPLRFRANIYIDGPPAWTELGWEHRDITLGRIRLRGASKITRCAATAVDPQTGKRDVPVPQLLREHFGHVCMGIYMHVTLSGELQAGDPVEYLEPAP